MKIIPKWDEYFMLEAINASTRSKDPSTQVGCVIVDKDNHQISVGYNGFPKLIDEGNFTWNKNPKDPYHEQKYAYVIHSEANAILHTNTSLKDCTLYVTLFPCNECAKLIVTKGISRVVYLEDKYHDSESGIASRKILSSANVNIEKINLRDSSIDNLINKLKKVKDL